MGYLDLRCVERLQAGVFRAEKELVLITGKEDSGFLPRELLKSPIFSNKRRNAMLQPIGISGNRISFSRSPFL